MSDIKCPYCGATDDSCVSDLWEYEGDDNEAECRSCEKEFTFSVDVSFTYNTKKQECNEGNHEPTEWKRFDYPDKDYSLWSRDCMNCDKYQIEKVGLMSDLHDNMGEFK